MFVGDDEEEDKDAAAAVVFCRFDASALKLNLPVLDRHSTRHLPLVCADLVRGKEATSAIEQSFFGGHKVTREKACRGVCAPHPLPIHLSISLALVPCLVLAQFSFATCYTRFEFPEGLQTHWIEHLEARSVLRVTSKLDYRIPEGLSQTDNVLYHEA